MREWGDFEKFFAVDYQFLAQIPNQEKSSLRSSCIGISRLFRRFCLENKLQPYFRRRNSGGWLLASKLQSKLPKRYRGL
jgi:hypothetical protein